ncbi:hypothetical protein [Mycobacterium tuberculosis]|uniref:hypothetical protein n=1 Tax=Mycobacterium tuberculosis TaxID=1773 RepID=UPI0008A93F63|nr:hypothetical protein [Mycobacterium tuberculosis]WGK25112.1 hypothetical protein LVJ73_12245 [Mycobacterium tuberculosis]SGN73199.1 ATP-dependent exoDNAse [Mycobacterium tuberculosis]
MVKPAARLSVVVGDVAANYDGRVVVAPTGQAVDVAVREGAGDVGYSVERENLPADDPVRNGSRWRVIAVDTEHHRIAARRLGDGARAAFSGDYLHEHITHGYAITVHASQGTTAHSTHAVLGDNTSRATLYVAMTPARESNTAYLCERTAGEGARVDLAGWDLWVSGKAEAMSDEKSASPVWCRVGARCDHRGKRSCW